IRDGRRVSGEGEWARPEAGRWRRTGCVLAAPRGWAAAVVHDEGEGRAHERDEAGFADLQVQGQQGPGPDGRPTRDPGLLLPAAAGEAHAGPPGRRTRSAHAQAP